MTQAKGMHMKIGITGGIGSGKSYICNRLKSLGFPVYNCDEAAKRLMVENEEIITSLRKLIDADAYTEQCTDDGRIVYSLNKPLIANFLFANSDNASKVNAIVHPIVKKDFTEWCERQKEEHVFMECAILFESNFDTVVDKCVLIYADEEKRLHRAMVRDNATEEQIRNRMRHQISNEEARKRADYIFDHNDYDTMDDELKKLIYWIEK